tara:strand:- start:10874 stop:11479 length:606 start_codon:yes stop_codon:yes gene_type:complete
MAGLGNPGTKYEGTRHNIGFMALERLAKQESVNFKHSKKLLGETAELIAGEKMQRLLKPNTFMNQSGRSVKAAMEWFGLQKEHILVIVDDIDLPLGKLRIRRKGSCGGHNGLQSIIQHLGTDEFCRLRIGIGAPSIVQEERKSRTISHVLGKFTREEDPHINKILDQVLLSLDLLKKSGFEQASNHINSYKYNLIINKNDK